LEIALLQKLVRDWTPFSRASAMRLADAYKFKGDIDSEIAGWKAFIEESLSSKAPDKSRLSGKMSVWKQPEKDNPHSSDTRDKSIRYKDSDAMELDDMKDKIVRREYFTEKLADAYICKGDIGLEIAGWKDLVKKDPSSTKLPVKLADAYYRRKMNIDLENLENMLFEADFSGTSSISMFNETDFVTTKLSIKRPTSLEDRGLYLTLWESAEPFYNLLEKLPSSAFALGLDILPNDISLADSTDAESFSGKSPQPKVNRSQDCGKCYGYNIRPTKRGTPRSF
jgi:hypothetical protein